MKTAFARAAVALCLISLPASALASAKAAGKHSHTVANKDPKKKSKHHGHKAGKAVTAKPSEDHGAAASKASEDHATAAAKASEDHATAAAKASEDHATASKPHAGHAAAKPSEERKAP